MKWSGPAGSMPEPLCPATGRTTRRAHVRPHLVDGSTVWERVPPLTLRFRCCLPAGHEGRHESVFDGVPISWKKEKPNG